MSVLRVGRKNCEFAIAVAGEEFDDRIIDHAYRLKEEILLGFWPTAQRFRILMGSRRGDALQQGCLADAVLAKYQRPARRMAVGITKGQLLTALERLRVLHDQLGQVSRRRRALGHRVS